MKTKPNDGLAGYPARTMTSTGSSATSDNEKRPAILLRETSAFRSFGGRLACSCRAQLSILPSPRVEKRLPNSTFSLSHTASRSRRWWRWSSHSQNAVRAPSHRLHLPPPPPPHPPTPTPTQLKTALIGPPGPCQLPCRNCWLPAPWPDTRTGADPHIIFPKPCRRV